MTPTLAADAPARRSAQPLFTLVSGLLVAFAAFGFAAWFSGAASWIAFYLGARGRILTTTAQATAATGFTLAVVAILTAYRRRCRRGQTDIPPKAALAACLALFFGNVFWAVFTDATAYHYGEDLVRPAFDIALMYLVLGGVPPLAVGIPLFILHLRRHARNAPDTKRACPACSLQ
jgi:hypothetical protein